MQSSIPRAGTPGALIFLCLLVTLFFAFPKSCELSGPATLPAVGARVPVPNAPGAPPSVDPTVPVIALSRCPEHVQRVVEHLRRSAPAWNPLKGFRGARIFKNYEGRLPGGTVYREYDVRAQLPGVRRGLERLVVSADRRQFYYSRDHYVTFTRIELP